MQLSSKGGFLCYWFAHLQSSQLDVGRVAPFASPIRFESPGLMHDPYTLPAGNPIDP